MTHVIKWLCFSYSCLTYFLLWWWYSVCTLGYTMRRWRVQNIISSQEEVPSWRYWRRLIPLAYQPSKLSLKMVRNMVISPDRIALEHLKIIRQLPNFITVEWTGWFKLIKPNSVTRVVGPHLGGILGNREVYTYDKHSVPCYLLKVGLKEGNIEQSGGASREASLPGRTENVNFVMTSHVKTLHLHLNFSSY